MHEIEIECLTNNYEYTVFQWLHNEFRHHFKSQRILQQQRSVCKKSSVKKSCDRAVTVTFESALHFYLILSIRPVPANSYMPYGGQVAICSVPVKWPVMSGWFYGRAPPNRPDTGQGPTSVWAASDWYMDCLDCPKFGPAPAQCVRWPNGYCPIAMRNAAPGFKSELVVTRCPPDSLQGVLVSVLATFNWPKIWQEVNSHHKLQNNIPLIYLRL